MSDWTNLAVRGDELACADRREEAVAAFLWALELLEPDSPAAVELRARVDWLTTTSR
jgi:hypothetical protein